MTLKQQRPGVRTASGKRVDPVGIVTAICKQIGSDGLSVLRAELEAGDISQAVRDHNTPALFDWLMGQLSYQGIADSVVDSYVAGHGNVTYHQIAQALSKAACPKLSGFEQYCACGYRKSKRTCANPPLLPSCPVPTHDLRNGNLNQLAYSLFLFLRDICCGDLVGFIDLTLEAADVSDHPDRLSRMRNALLDALRGIHGVSDKILSMTFANLLIRADAGRPRWSAVGGSMIAVDSLVHNFLHRTGILDRLGARHRYGAACYRQQACVGVLDRLARSIDARAFGPELPAYFPRFVQYALWAFCAHQQRNICNGNRIDDQLRCNQQECPIYRNCGRVPLKGRDTRTVPKGPPAARPPPLRSVQYRFQPPVR